MAKNEIIMAGDVFGENKIIDARAYMSQSIDGTALEYDTFDARLKFAPTDDPAKYTYGVPIVLQKDGAPVSKFYLRTLTKVGKDIYQIDSISAIGLLETAKHYGGIYTGQTMRAVVADIIGDIMPWSIAQAIADEEVRGWLPISTRRRNLHSLLFAMGAVALPDAAGDIYITPILSASHKEIPDDKIFVDSSVEYQRPPSMVSITEHAFYKTIGDQDEIIFEGEVIAEQLVTPGGANAFGALILFQQPMYGLTVSDGGIIEQGPNYAVIQQSAECTLTGKPYTHTEREVSQAVPYATKADTNIITIPDGYLINAANSGNVLARVFEYHTSAKKVSLDIIADNERPCDFVKFLDPFGDPSEGIISALSVTPSNIWRAQAEIITGYTPGPYGNMYNHIVVLTTDQDFVVPEGVRRVRAVLISGGDGAESGQTGQNGNDGVQYTPPNTAGTRCRPGVITLPGKGGKRGRGGKVAVISKNVKPGQKLRIHIGAGGPGGQAPDRYEDGTRPGSPGEPTTLDEYSSEMGVRMPEGYTEPITNVVYARDGVRDGVDAGRGGGQISPSGPETSKGDIIRAVDESGVERTWYYGSRQRGTCAPYNGGKVCTDDASSGWGGGPAYMSRGGTGLSSTLKPPDNADYNVATCGNGGPGGSYPKPTSSPSPADPDYWDKVSYGDGGAGGHGGGSGGGAGGGQLWRYTAPSGVSYDKRGEYSTGKGGPGGHGSNGAPGAPGCVILYY